jgi:hypothetical protein
MTWIIWIKYYHFSKAIYVKPDTKRLGVNINILRKIVIKRLFGKKSNKISDFVISRFRGQIRVNVVIPTGNFFTRNFRIFMNDSPLEHARFKLPKKKVTFDNSWKINKFAIKSFFDCRKFLNFVIRSEAKVKSN